MYTPSYLVYSLRKYFSTKRISSKSESARFYQNKDNSYVEVRLTKTILEIIYPQTCAFHLRVINGSLVLYDYKGSVNLSLFLL